MTKLRLITRRDRVRNLCAYWKDMSLKITDWGSSPDQQHNRAVCERLCELDPETVSPDEVDRLVSYGLSSTILSCNACSKHVDAIVEISEESSTTWLCKGCIKEAASLLEPTQ